MSLPPSQRVTLLKVIAERLSNEKWQFIDTTLQQFGIETPESWSGFESDYIMRATQKAQIKRSLTSRSTLDISLGSLFLPASSRLFGEKTCSGYSSPTLPQKGRMRESCRRLYLGLESHLSSHITT